ncbi:MAG: ABC transporter ATP-binding protein [Planctomycetaceae bacterium]
MSDSEVLISCENVGKKFCRDLKKSLWYGVKDSFADLVGRRSQLPAADCQLSTPELRSGEFWANQDINFELKRGECLGLIGGNGAGKTTLLKMLNGLIKPNTGQITMKGRVAAMIALGAGFNPILTGRENVIVNGTILGLSRREIMQRLDDVVAFADIEHAIDSPVRTYSSGMQVRLGFAAASILHRPDILLIDEVLSVGDVGFRIKCYNQISSLLKDTAVVFVSHNGTDIKRICDTLMALRNGTIWFSSNDVSKALDRFERSNTCGAVSPEIVGGNIAEFTNFLVYDNNTSEVTIELEIQAKVPIFGPELMLTLLGASGESASQVHCGNLTLCEGTHRLQIFVPRPQLASSEYRVTVSIHERTGKESGVLLAANRGNFKWPLDARSPFEFATTVIHGRNEVASTQAYIN